MKRLFLLRHAQTMPGDGISDIERRLTPEGHADALALGRTMKAKSYQPDFVFCSSARRTQETLKNILEVIGPCPTETTAKIYNGGMAELLHLIQSAAENMKSVLLVGHNPSIHQLAGALSDGTSASLCARLTIGYAPGTLSVFDCPCDSWLGIQPGENALLDLLEPGDYNAQASAAQR